MMNYFSSDFHLGHKAILKYRDNFNSCEEHDLAILDLVATLKKRDILFVLGDFIFDSDKYDYYIEQFNKMPCRIKLIMGNHDSLKLYKEDRFEMQLPLFLYKNNWISHAPIHPQELRGKDLNIHGHLHNDIIHKREYNILDDCDDIVPDKRYFNVNLDNNNFNLVSFEEIKETIR